MAYEINVFDGSTLTTPFISVKTYTTPKALLDGLVFKDFTTSSGKVNIAVSELRGSSKVEVFEDISNLQTLSLSNSNIKENREEIKEHISAVYANYLYDIQDNQQETTVQLREYAQRFLDFYSPSVLDVKDLDKQAFLESFSSGTIHGSFLYSTLNRYEQFLNLTTEDVLSFVVIELLSGRFFEGDGGFQNNFILRKKTDENVGVSQGGDRPNSFAYRKIVLGTKELLVSFLESSGDDQVTVSSFPRGTYLLNEYDKTKKHLEVFKGLHHFYEDTNNFSASLETGKTSVVVKESPDSLNPQNLSNETFLGSSAVNQEFENFFLKSTVTYPTAQKNISKSFSGLRTFNFRKQEVNVSNIEDVLGQVSNTNLINIPMELDSLPQTLSINNSQDSFIVLKVEPDTPQTLPLIMESIYFKINYLYHHSEFITVIKRGSDIKVRYDAPIVNVVKGSTETTLTYESLGLFSAPVNKTLVFNNVNGSSSESGCLSLEKNGELKFIELDGSRNVTDILNGSQVVSFTHRVRLTTGQQAIINRILTTDGILLIAKNKLKSGFYDIDLRFDPLDETKGLRREGFNRIYSYAVEIDSDGIRDSKGVAFPLLSIEQQGEYITLTGARTKTIKAIEFFNVDTNTFTFYDIYRSDILESTNLLGFKGTLLSSHKKAIIYEVL